MPRITAERREARRTAILAAARRCFSRDGFHQTSMPDIAREAGLCGIQAWGELMRHDMLRERAAAGFDAVRARVADVLRQGQARGDVPVDLDPDNGARVVMALLPGFILQRQAFGLDDVDGFVRAVGTLLGRTPPSEQPV